MIFRSLRFELNPINHCKLPVQQVNNYENSIIIIINVILVSCESLGTGFTRRKRYEGGKESASLFWESCTRSRVIQSTKKKQSPD